jgi:ATP-dependent DNA ligase
MEQVTPMLARSAHPFSDADWIFEVKWDIPEQYASSMKK